MKSYFARYLSAEGKPKIGDLVINGIFVYKASITDIDEDSVKKAQLFLCNRDIQVGDTCRGQNPNSLSPTLSTLSLVQKAKELGWFKVIGPISPEATWVREGDEFDEKEVIIRKICHDDSHPPYDSYCSHCSCSSKCLNDEGDEALIKGPCGHFH